MYSKVFGEGSEGCKKVIPLGKIGQPDDIGKVRFSCVESRSNMRIFLSF